jgi:diguanylate cyclase (GGDEF)-like protein
MLQLGFLIATENRLRHVRAGQERYFLWMLIITLLSFVANILSSLNPGRDWFFYFTAAGNYCEFIFNALLLPIFYLYICEQISDIDLKLKRRLTSILLIMVAICIALVLSTAFTGQIFYFDNANVYHRGPFFLHLMFIYFVMMVIIEFFIISKKQKIEAKYYKSLALFMISPLIGWTLQSSFYGLPFSLIGITFAAQVVFTNIQNRRIDKDYLTGIFNRQALDSYMQHMIDISTNRRTFSAILIDVDYFKSINDCFGHYEGDTALVNVARLLRYSVGSTDFIARYGGDEFCVILDKDDPRIVEDTIHHISSRLAAFNQNNDKPYQLSLSMGYSVYHPSMGKKAEMLFNEIDQKMYKEKNSRPVMNHVAAH